MAEITPPMPPRIAGYDYVRPLGAGGFAHVFLYEQDMPRRVAAVKVIDSDFSAARDRSDFEAEADAMARLSSHPSIVSMWDAGVSVDGRAYIAMEYCPDSMRDRTRGNPAALGVVLDAGVRLAGALETAHRAGVLHRDIKPSNVLIATTGRPALADFGISMLQGRGSTDDKARAMSIPWAAPEVVSNVSTGSIASEIWSLGATLYTFAAGHSPFERSDRSQNTQDKMIARITQARYTPIPGAQGYAAFDEVIAHAMSKQPEQRFASMLEFAEALQRLQRHYGLDVTPLDIVDASWVAPAVSPSGTRMPQASTVRQNSRAQARAEKRRAELQADEDGIVVDRRPNLFKAGVIGAVVGVVAVGAVVASAFLFGWVG